MKYRKLLLGVAMLVLAASVASAAPPTPPQRLNASGGDNGNGTLSAYLNWFSLDSGSQNITRYNVYISTDGGTTYSVYDTVGVDNDSVGVYYSYNFTTQTEGEYFFQVTAVNADGESDPSNWIGVGLHFRPIRITNYIQWGDSLDLGTTYTYDFDAVAGNPNESVRFGIVTQGPSASSNPAATIDSLNGEFSWTPTVAEDGEFLVAAWLASDPSKRDSVWFRLVIIDPARVDFTSQALYTRCDTGQTVTHTVHAISHAGGTVTYQVISMGNSSTIDVSLDANSGQLSLTPHAYATYQFQIGAFVDGETTPRATQGGYLTASDPSTEPLMIVGDVLDSTRFNQVPSVVYAYRRTSVNPVEYTVVDTAIVDYNYFYFRELPGGAYIFRAVPNDTVHAAGYYRANDYASLTWDDATVVSSGNGLDSVEIMLPFLEGHGINRLRGDVTRSGGRAGLRQDGRSLGSADPALEGAAVYAVDANGNVQGMDVTDAAGHYEIGNLGIGTFTVIVDKIGFTATTGTVTFADNSGSTQDQNIKAEPASGTSGVILDPIRVERARVAPTPTPGAATIQFTGVAGGAELTIQSTDGRTVQHSNVTTTTGNNVVALQTSGLEAGNYIVRIAMPGRMVSAPLVIVR